MKTTNGCIKAAIPDKDPSCDTQTGNPVDASSGMKLEYALDFTTAGSIPLKFERHYRSNTNTLDGKYQTSRLGTGWRSNFDSSAYYWPTTSHPSSSIRFLLPDGTNYAFKESSNLFVQRYYSWSSKAWKSAAINRYAKAAWVSTTQRYELTTPDDTVWSYDTDGRLRTIAYSGGYTQTLSYDTSGNNTSVSDTVTNPLGKEAVYHFEDDLQGLNRLAHLEGKASSNRLSFERSLSGMATEMSYAYAPFSNRLNDIAANGSSLRSLLHDAAGNIIQDVRGANVYAYSYDAANRLSGVTRDGVLWASYLYNGFSQLASRTLTAASATPGTVHYLYDTAGHLIAEADGSTGETLREYLWLDDLPVAVIEGETLYHVVTDHLYRPIAMYDAAGSPVWSAVWEPFGALHSVSGSLSLDARLPGQWYQLESGLHYNWHRHYDPSLGRYTQPDPIGLGGGMNRFAYASNNPVMKVDPDGRFAIALPFAIPILEAIGGMAVGVAAGAMMDAMLDRPQEPALPPSIPLPKLCLDGTNWGGGGGGRNNDPECDDEWKKALDRCEEELRKRYPNRRSTGNYKDPYNCAKGYVSQHCGGNRVH